MNQRDALKAASRYLRADAEVSKEACGGDERPWSCTSCERTADGVCVARFHHDERMRLAKILELFSSGI